MRAPWYLKVHPMGRVPAFEDGGQIIFESGAIVRMSKPDMAMVALCPKPLHPDLVY